LWRIYQFGGVGRGLPDYKFESTPFKNEEEREQATMLFIEAMLMMSSNYDSNKRPDGYDRIEYGGRLYTKKDFGMA
jgi:hypothetical protein